MKKYCVNRREQDTGEHEVHSMDCEHLPDPVNQVHLGSFDNCHDAVKEAKKHFDDVDGCYYCSKECHTR